MLELRAKLGLNCSPNTARAASTRPEAAAKTPGRWPSERPTLANRAAPGPRFHPFEGQNRAFPRTVTTAGTSVRAATRVTATAIANAGPIERKMLSELSSRARNATITAPPADAIASPARSRACTTEERGEEKGRRRERERKRKK